MAHHGPELRGRQTGLSPAGVLSQEEAGLPQGQVSNGLHTTARFLRTSSTAKCCACLVIRAQLLLLADALLQMIF